MNKCTLGHRFQFPGKAQSADLIGNFASYLCKRHAPLSLRHFVNRCARRGCILSTDGNIPTLTCLGKCSVVIFEELSVLIEMNPSVLGASIHTGSLSYSASDDDGETVAPGVDDDSRKVLEGKLASGTNRTWA